MSMFGTEAPKFVYHYGLVDEVAVDLDYAVVVVNDAESEYQEHISEIDRDREFVFRRTNRTVEIVVNAFKESDPTAKYNEICAYKGREVVLYLHRDGFPFALELTNEGVLPAPFVLKDVVPFFYETASYKDGLRLTFASVCAAGYGENIMVAISGLYDSEGIPLYDSDGKRLTAIS